MSFRVSRNLGPHSTGPQSIYALKEWLKTGHPGTKHWSVVASGDGLSAYSSSGDVITHSGSGANGLDNNNAWFVLRDPDDNRELLFHRTTLHYSWNLWYLRGAHFDTTSADADTPATHANKKSWMGPRGVGPGTFFPTSGSWYFHICCEGDTAEGNVYPFWAVGRVSGSGVEGSIFMLDCVIDSLSPAGDDDKAVLLGAGGSALRHDSGAYLGYSNSSAFLSGFLRWGELNEEWAWYALAFYGDNNGNYYPGTVPTHPEDGKLPIFPGFYWRRGSTVNGVKGQSRLMTYKPSTSQAMWGDTMYDGTDYHLVVDHVLLRGWPDSTGPSI